MSIRSNLNAKDKLRDIPVVLQVVKPTQEKPTAHSLRFRTNHKTKPIDVDLTIFATGQDETTGRGRLHNGPYKGRPELIMELAPSLQDHLSPLAEKSVFQHLQALRTWWRLLDQLEAEAPHMAPVTSVAQLSELHRQRATDQGMDRMAFGLFLLHVNNTRLALGLKALVWPRPSVGSRVRKLPPTWQTDMVRRELKHGWFRIVDRWELADALLATQEPVLDGRFPEDAEKQAALLKGYLRLERAIEATGHPRPQATHLGDSETGMTTYYAEGILLMEILRGRYPDGADIRMAFHLCLATTGWNPAVLLALDANEPFIEAHPRSPSRYVLRGIKDRAAGAEQVSEGLFKSQGSAGFVLQTLLRRTAPLRAELVRMRTAVLGRLAEAAELTAKQRQQLTAQADELSQGIRSPWLFVSHVNDGIHWLHDDNYAGSTLKKTSFLLDVIGTINLRQPTDRQLASLVPGDLRDAYAAQVYHASGGSILAVMNALGHRGPKSTQDYLDNTLLKEEHRKLFSIFSGAFWGELEANGRVDPSLLAKISRDGDVSSDERVRLESYRSLLRSRVGMGCKEPTNPPKHLAPSFVADGEKLCPVQRCMLCFEHAVLLPESLDGLCKRISELDFIKASMSVVAWQQSSFAEEMENTELALTLFEPADVAVQRATWVGRIQDRTHWVPEFDGLGMEN